MKVAAIRDRETLERWLNARPEDTRQSDAVAIAFRAACRVMPIYGRAMGQDWARKDALTALPVLRCLVTSGVARKYPTPEVKAAAVSAVYVATARAATAATAAAYDAAHAAAHAAADASSSVTAAADSAAADSADAAAYADSAAAYADSAAYIAAYAADSAATARAAAAAWEEIRNDCRALAQGQDPDALPLWHDAANPLGPAWTETRVLWQQSAPAYDFWLRWYQALLDATPLPPALLRAIALIPDKDWKLGPAHVAELIAKIEDRFNLLLQIAELKKLLGRAEREAVTPVASVEQRSHNNPPELVEMPVELRREVVIIWAALDGAETELEKDEPEPAILQRIGTALVGAAKRILVYCGCVADVTIKAAAEELGKTGTKFAIRIVGAYYVAQALQIQAVGKAILDFGQKLFSGG